MVDEVALTPLQEQQLRELGVLPRQAGALLRSHPDFTRLLRLARYGADLSAAGSLLGQDVPFDEVMRMAGRGTDLAMWEQSRHRDQPRSPAPDDGSAPAAGQEVPCSEQEWQELFDHGLRGREMRAALRLRALDCSQGQVLLILESGGQPECASRCRELGLTAGQVEHLAVAGADLGAVCLLLEEDAEGEDVFALAAAGLDPWLVLDLAEAGGSVRQARGLAEEGLSLAAAADLRGQGLSHEESLVALRATAGRQARPVRLGRPAAAPSKTLATRTPARSFR